MKFPALLISLCAALVGCLSDDSSVKDGIEGDVIHVAAFSIEGNRIISQPWADTQSHCEKDSLVRNIYSHPSDTDEYRIDAGTLTLYQKTRVTQSGAVIQPETRMTRIGSGTGLEGVWLSKGLKDRLVSGTLTADEQAQFDEWNALYAQSTVHIDIRVRIEGGISTTYRDADRAALFIEKWNGGAGFDGKVEPVFYDITVTTLNRLTVELKGLKSGESVRITEDNTGNLTWSSNRPENATSRHHSAPQSCPNPAQPDWYFNFFEANRK